MNIEILRALLVGCLLAMYILTMIFLRRRQLTPGQFAGWRLLALLFPARGPFLVILNQPGGPPRRIRPRRIRRQWL